MKTVTMYKGCPIYYSFPSGMYQTYVNGMFYVSDTLQGCKNWIDQFIKR